MKLFEYALLTDENVHPAIARTLRERGVDVVTVRDLGMIGLDDSRIMASAASQNRVVITQDRNVGRSHVLSGKAFVGIVCVRPGSIPWNQVIRVLGVVNDHSDSLRSPFVVIAVLDGDEVRMRIRLQSD